MFHDFPINEINVSNTYIFGTNFLYMAIHEAILCIEHKLSLEWIKVLCFLIVWYSNQCIG